MTIDPFHVSHAPPGYDCPFCRLYGAGDSNLTRGADIVHRDEAVMAFVSLDHWPPSPGHALVIPAVHYETMYAMPDDLGARIFALVRDVGVAMKRALACDGVSTRQHNEPAGNQDVWHYHHHVFPRFTGDNLYGAKKVRLPAEARAALSARIRDGLRLGG